MGGYALLIHLDCAVALFFFFFGYERALPGVAGDLRLAMFLKSDVLQNCRLSSR